MLRELSCPDIRGADDIRHSRSIAGTREASDKS